MKNLLFLFSVLILASCGSKTVETFPDNTKPLNVQELTSYIGKSYSSIESNFNNFSTKPTVTESLGDKKVKVFLEDKSAPTPTFSCVLQEKNGNISEILIESTVDFNVRRDLLKFFNDKTMALSGVSNTTKMTIRDDGSVRPFTGSLDDFFANLRNNTNYGGLLEYETSALKFQSSTLRKTDLSYGLLISKK